MKEITRLKVDSGTSIKEALARLNETGVGMLLLIDSQGRLLRTVTDGDIRRLLLEGHTLETFLDRLPLLMPKTVSTLASSDVALSLMNEHLVNHVPVVDQVGRPQSLFVRREVDSPILLSVPHLSEYERQYVEEAFSTNWVAPLGPNVEAFERELAAYVSIEHAAALNSGTAALHLALRLLDLKAGDSVFCSTLTFVASANPILYERAIPVFLDSEPSSWGMSPIALKRALADASRDGRLPKAVVVTNLYGQSADLDPILALCDQYNVPVVEDAAESLGATYKGKASGTLGRLGVYSFNGNKIITTSGGGMLVSKNNGMIEKARKLATQARDAAPYYEHSEIGYNYRMSNVLAGIGRGQLRVLEDRINARRSVFDRYQMGLSHLTQLLWMPEPSFGRATHWLSVCTIDSQKTAIGPADIIRKLAVRGIEARHIWKPMHRQPLFAGCKYYSHDPTFSVSDELFAAGICLPSGSNLSTDQQNRIIREIESIIQT